jgi:dienelactone hydrolase
MQNKKFTLSGKHDKPIFGDVTFQANQKAKVLVIFCHGYKGFKDWGAWHLLAEAFAEAGFFFAKFNFSHNGVEAKNLTEFSDLQAFGMDNYSKQLDDLNSVIDYFEKGNEFSDEIDFSKLELIGHSRGGGVAVLQANEDNRVKQLITWAGVSDFGNRFPKGKKLAQWKEEGVYYIINGRTKEKMPHFIQFYEDFLANQKRFHIKTAVSDLKIPYLILHGTQDEAVDAYEAEVLFDTAKNAKIKWIANANHVFGMSHPWDDEELPIQAKIVANESISFLKK